MPHEICVDDLDGQTHLEAMDISLAYQVENCCHRIYIIIKGRVEILEEKSSCRLSMGKSPSPLCYKAAFIPLGLSERETGATSLLS